MSQYIYIYNYICFNKSFCIQMEWFPHNMTSWTSLPWPNPNSFIQVRFSRHHDLLCAVGWLAAMQACRRMVAGSLVWLGVPCSSWIWLSRGSTFRCRVRPRGSRRISKVKKANRLVRRLCFMFLGCDLASVVVFFPINPNVTIYILHVLNSGVVWFDYPNLFSVFSYSKIWYGIPLLPSPRLEYLHTKGVGWAIEQPASSLLPLYRPLEDRVQNRRVSQF